MHRVLSNNFLGVPNKRIRTTPRIHGLAPRSLPPVDQPSAPFDFDVNMRFDLDISIRAVAAVSRPASGALCRNLEREVAVVAGQGSRARAPNGRVNVGRVVAVRGEHAGEESAYQRSEEG